MSLRARIVSLVSLIFLVGSVLAGVLAGLEARRALEDELHAAMVGGQQTVLSAFEDLPRSDHAPRDLHQLVATFDGNRHVRALLTDSAGKLLEGSVPPDRTTPAPAWFGRLLGAPRI